MPYDRRAFLAYFSSLGLGGTLLPGVLWARIQQPAAGPEITKEMVAAAEEVAGLSFSDEERAALARGLQGIRNAAKQIRAVPLDQTVLPALVFEPVPAGVELPAKQKMAMVRGKQPCDSRRGRPAAS